MELTLRPADLGDRCAVESLWLELNAHHVAIEPQRMRRVREYQSAESFCAVCADPKQELVLLCHDTHVIGAVWLVERTIGGGPAIETRVAFIQELSVSEAHRRQGHGTRLLQAAEAWGRERGAARLEFNVWAANHSAIAFYQSLGYHYARHEMAKPLSQP